MRFFAALLVFVLGCGPKPECETYAEEYCELLIRCVQQMSRAECKDRQMKYLADHKYSEDECFDFRTSTRSSTSCEAFREAIGANSNFVFMR